MHCLDDGFHVVAIPERRRHPDAALIEGARHVNAGHRVLFRRNVCLMAPNYVLGEDSVKLV